MEAVSQCRSARPGFTDDGNGVFKKREEEEEEIPPSTGKLITIGLMKLNGPHSASLLSFPLSQIRKLIEG